MSKTKTKPTDDSGAAMAAAAAEEISKRDQGVQAADSPPRRTSEVTRSISRKLNTAQFETIEIRESWSETVTWTTLEERDQKLKNWEALLLQSYVGTHDRILDALGLQHKKAFVSGSMNGAPAPQPGLFPNGSIPPVPAPPPVVAGGGKEEDMDLVDPLPDL
jgi:hypothetical protein